jgi:serine/threonine-protein kinase HipA
MRRAIVFAHGKERILTEIAANDYHFEYDENYDGEAVSLTMPTTRENIAIHSFHLF